MVHIAGLEIRQTWCTTACSRWGALRPGWRLEREGWLARCCDGGDLALIAVMLPSGAALPARNMAILRGVFALFAASGLLFRHASLTGLK
jgi:hypothetical protein